MSTLQIIGLIVVALLGLYVFYCIYDLEKYNKRKNRRRKSKVLTMALLILTAIAGEKNAMAQWTGAGTQGSPYQIKSKEDLYTLATNVNSGTNYNGYYFELTTDLTYTYTYAWNSTDYYASENNYTAIGAYGNSFKGHFDGGGHTISGIRIYKNGTTNADQLQGVFGNLSGGSVRNLTVADASITGYQQVGAIAGCNNGTIEDCVVASNVGIYRVADNASKHGGVVGANSNGNVRRCTTSATVKSHPKFANTISAICGGIIGYQSQSQDVNHYVEDNVALNVVVISGQSVGGAIIGHRTSDDNLNRLHLSRNYYRNCTINGSVNATNVGLGNPAGDMNGARSVHALTLGTNITATGESVVIGNTTYYASNTTVTLGHNNSTGYLVTYRLNGNALGGNTFTMPNNDNGTVSATLTPITYYVHFDKNNDGASGTMSDQQFTYGQAQNLTANAFSRTGYDFIGWSTTFNGEAEYTDGQSVSNLTAEDGQTVTLYAKWNISNYNITYNLDGGTVATENPTTYNIETPTFSLNNPTQAGCTFDGWTGTGLTEATQTVTIAQGSTGDRSYTANWTYFAYALVLDNDITATPAPAATYNNTSYYTPGTDITLSYNVTPSAGYEFQGFLVNGSPIEGNTFVMPASDVTVSANLAAIPWGGAGTSDSPYIIIYAAQLDMLATRLNTGTGDDYASNGYSGKYFKLGADINYNPNELINGENYTAIGNEDYQFNGTFDGDNHIISGIRINKPDYYLQGLFGEIASSGTVKNVILDDAVVIGRNCVGGIAGNKLGTIENCRVINTNITGNSMVGGIAGHSANQTIENNMVLNTAITCDDSELIVIGGAIIGSQQSGSIGYNYYHNCTLNGVASNIGCGVASIGNMIVGDITSHNGAVQAYTLTLSPHITATPAPNVTFNNIDYYTAGTEVTLGTNPPAYTITSATLTYGGNNHNIASVGGVYSFTMPAADVSVTVTEIQGDRYQLFEGNIVEGDYLIVYNLKGNLCAMNNVISNHAFQYEVVNAIDNVITTDNADIVWHIAPNSDGNWTIYNAAIGKYAGGRLAQSGAQLYDETDYCATWIVGYSCEFQNRNDGFLGFRTRGTTIIGFDVRGFDLYNPIYTNLLLYKKVEVPTGNYNFDSTTGELTLISGEFNKDNKWGNDVDPSAVTSVTATDQVSFTGDCTDLFSGFESCTSMDLNSVNTVNVTNMAGMFHNCSSLQSLDLSGWNTAGVLDMTSMFKNCSSLVTIYVGTAWSTENVTLSSEVFYNCISIVGGNGCPYFSTYSWYWDPGLTYAHIDMPDNPGYLTGRFNKAIAGYQDDESGWYLIASPLAAEVAPTAVTNMTNATFDLYYFDQSGGDNGKEWKNYKAHSEFTSLFNGQGYLYANSEDVKLSFTGTPIGGTTNVVTLTKTTGVALEGWNLVGNPFADTAYILDKRPFYIMNDLGSEIIAAVEVSRNYLKPMEGVFVEATTDNETMTFTTQKPVSSPSSALVINVNQTVTNRGVTTTAVIDRAIVRFDEGCQLPKLQIFENSPKLYIPQGGEEYAIAYSNGQGEMPVNFKAKKNGEYTLTVSESLNSKFLILNYLHLIDNLTGADIDLLTTPSYTFTAKTTDYASRFKLVFNTQQGGAEADDNFAFISNGEIIISGEGTMQVVDVMGRVLISHEVTSDFRLPTSGFSAGVYVLRLINGENVKTQKILVK